MKRKSPLFTPCSTPTSIAHYKNAPDHRSNSHQKLPTPHRRVERHQVRLHEHPRVSGQQGHEPGCLHQWVLRQQLQAERVFVHGPGAGSAAPFVVGRALLAAALGVRACFLCGGAVGCFLGECSLTRYLCVCFFLKQGEREGKEVALVVVVVVVS